MLARLYGWQCQSVGTDVHGPQMMNPDPQTFPVAPPAGQSSHLCCEISQLLLIYWMDWHQIMNKHIFFPEDEAY